MKVNFRSRLKADALSCDVKRTAKDANINNIRHMLLSADLLTGQSAAGLSVSAGLRTLGGRRVLYIFLYGVDVRLIKER